MTSIDLTPIISQALDCLYTNDRYLIVHEGLTLPNMDSHVSERGIVFRFGIYLQQHIYKHPILQDYNIDAEYNRNHDNVKALPDTQWAKNGALPDLIIHKRGSNENNLLVVEFKAWWSDGSLIEADKEKLIAFKKPPYRYKNALLLILNKERYSMEWIGG